MGPGFVAEITYFAYYCANDKMELCDKKKSCLTMANAFHINVTALVHPVCCGRKKNCMAHLQTPSALDNGVYIVLYPKLKSSPSRYIKLNKLVANVQNLCSFIYTTCNFSSCM